MVSGFWHGASWNFIVWGGIHACGFLPLLISNKNRKYVNDVVAQDRKLPNLKELWQMISTFGFVTFAWIFFRSHGIYQAFAYIKQIIVSLVQSPSQFYHKAMGLSIFYYIIPLVAFDWYFRKNERSLKSLKCGNNLIYISLIVSIILYYFNSSKNTFIYFQF